MMINNALIVDDSKLSRMTLRRLLKVEGINVVEAESVAEAFEKLKTEKIDAIFMDVMMPQVDGFEGIEQIKSDPKYSDIPCVMYSGNLSVESQEEAVEKGAKAYLFKPASRSSLQNVLSSLSGSYEPPMSAEMDNLGPLSQAQSEQEGSLGQLQESINIVEVRTKNLARVLMQERKERERLQQSLDEKIEEDKNRVNLMKIERLEQENLSERTEKNLYGQIRAAQHSIRRLATISAFAIILALVAFIAAIYAWYFK